MWAWTNACGIDGGNNIVITATAGPVVAVVGVLEGYAWGRSIEV
jgi:hypothetical protein